MTKKYSEKSFNCQGNAGQNYIEASSWVVYIYKPIIWCN